MDSEKPNFHTTKLLTTWWDLVDHYVLAVMLAVSGGIGWLTNYPRSSDMHFLLLDAQTSQGMTQLCARWKEYRDVLDTCDQSSSSVVLTKMSDRRQYDYIDKRMLQKVALVFGVLFVNFPLARP